MAGGQEGGARTVFVLEEGGEGGHAGGQRGVVRLEAPARGEGARQGQRIWRGGAKKKRRRREVPAEHAGDAERALEGVLVERRGVGAHKRQQTLQALRFKHRLRLPPAQQLQHLHRLLRHVSAPARRKRVFVEWMVREKRSCARAAAKG
eukprot:503203-Rhodomonas_salina.2